VFLYSDLRNESIPSQPRRPISPLLDLTDKDALMPAVKPPPTTGKMTPAPPKVHKGSKRAAAAPRTKGDLE
jgi:hypothetical protein